ncbi:uncharacterized protein LOC135827874 [Sycon ciliatum]|uniref:uncharacterized protein LOC135827874 n=1 Tax=Sycon ciliatum TaxID=27933 RepID=UPI0031F5F8F2
MTSAPGMMCQRDADCAFGQSCCEQNQTMKLFSCCRTSSTHNIFWIVSVFFGVSMLFCVLAILKEKLHIHFGHSATGSRFCCFHRRRRRRRTTAGSPVSRRRHVSVRVNTGSVSSSHAPSTVRRSTSAETSVLCEAGPPPYSDIPPPTYDAPGPVVAYSQSVVTVAAELPLEEPPKYSEQDTPLDAPPSYYALQSTEQCASTPDVIDTGSELHGRPVSLTDTAGPSTAGTVESSHSTLEAATPL